MITAPITPAPIIRLTGVWSPASLSALADLLLAAARREIAAEAAEAAEATEREQGQAGERPDKEVA